MDRILGQDRAISVLQTQLAADRPHHAYIFGGPVGVGKFTTALAFARLLLCHEPRQGAAGGLIACEACASCRLLPPIPSGAGPSAGPSGESPSDQRRADAEILGAGAHPDLHVITKELARYSDDANIRNRKLTQIPVEVLREHLLEPVQRAARMRHGKVFVIDEAELLNPTGQNLLLKTLEEPPAGTTLILVTASEDRLLPTIRSRCHRIAFVPLPDELIDRWLAEQAPELALPDRQWLVEFATGSPGRAKLALDYELTEWARVILPVLDRIAHGRPSGMLGQEIARRIDAFAERWVDRHANASKESANKLAADLMGALITARARRRLIELVDEAPPGDPVAQEAKLEPWLGVIDAVQRMRELLASNVNLSLTCDHLVARIAMSHEP